MATNKKHVFTQMEKKVFLEILKTYSHVVENKDTDGSSLRAKTEAWEKITSDYNASPYASVQVTSKQLRRFWMNLKQRQRDALTKERQHRLATGGGPSTSDANIDPDVSQVAPALIVGVDEAIDSDTLTESADVIVEMVSSDVVMESQPVSSHSILYSIPSTSAVLPSTEPSQPHSPPPTVSTPQPPPLSIPPHSSPAYTIPSPPPSSVISFQRQKKTILDKEFMDRKRRADEIHALEILLLRERIREAKAKADLAEFILQQKKSSDTPEERNEPTETE